MKYTKSFSALTFALATVASASALADLPVYSEAHDTLLIPAIDFPGRPGAFQDAELELGSNNLWKLKDVVEAKLNTSIEKVELVQTNTFPVQAILKISGEYTHGCARTGQTHAVWDGQKLLVSSYYENNLWVKSPETVSCTMAITPFSFEYPLPVYGLAKGDYPYQVNGKFSGTVKLTKDNVHEE